MVVSCRGDVDGVLLAHDRRRGLEGHPEVDRLAVADAALDAAAAVGARAHAVALHVERVVVLASRVRSVPAKPEPISKPLLAGRLSTALARSASRRSKTGSPQPGGQPRTAQVTTPPSESPALRAASTAAIIRSATREIGAADRRPLDLLARDLLDDRSRRPARPTLVDPGDDLDAVALGSSLRAMAPAATRPAVSRALVRPPPRQSRMPYLAS